MSGSLIYLILMIFVLIRFLTAGKKQNKTGNRGTSSSTASKNTSAGRNARKAAGNGPMAADGHRVPKDQDISCRRFGHNHEEFDTPRYIPHEDPEEGYIVLNGVRMKLSEADAYENRI